ncbi:hypothetical protein KO498_13280 [Lentibacter algarum]|uniref:hypothetical protein n=1 Tax=Lentibacter algarum TaxID=576131 RepID=UPI001C099D31|nr:hypothetical protein [Lentibacter algarum]MBU2982783.1 hypothetical protein [Lentibacter algarum]
MSRKIYLHAGAHRTGTSSFQNCLAVNREQLAREGFDLAYPGRDGAPNGQLRMRLPRPRHKPDEQQAFVGKVKRTLKKQVTDKPKLILSEENLPGVIVHFFKGKLYPNRKPRLQVFRDALEAIDGKVAHVVFVIRPYDDLFISGFRKHAEDNAVKPFAEHAEAMSNFSGGWVETVQALRNVLDPEQLTVVDYAVRGKSRELLGRLTGAAAETYQEPRRDLNTSATDAAMHQLQEIYRSGQTLERAAWQAVIRDNADRRDDLRFTHFTDPQKARLDERYEADKSRLAEMGGITLITT